MRTMSRRLFPTFEKQPRNRAYPLQTQACCPSKPLPYPPSQTDVPEDTSLQSVFIMRSPIDSRDSSDPGDRVIRKFRYQHAYGVVLAVLMMNKTRPYRAIWCEQHEDLLAERTDGLFEAFQVKTRKPEIGPWKLTDVAFFKSIKRFVDLDSKHPGRINKFHFVSNTEYSDSDAKNRIHHSPIKLSKAVAAANSKHDLEGPALVGFEALRGASDQDGNALFSVLQRLELVLGPTEKAFEDELCQSHLPTLPLCSGLSAGSLKKVLNSLIGLMERAASLQSKDPLRHCIGLTSTDEVDPYLFEKRVCADEVTLAIRDACELGVQYLEELATLSIGKGQSSRNVLKKKLDRGGLGARYEAMRRKVLTAESALLDFVTRPDGGRQKLSQIENVVLSECDEAHLLASFRQPPYGPAMLIDVYDRLKEIASKNPIKVSQQPYEVLVGVAGLLTSDCKVWWSDEFQIEGDQ